MEILPADDTGIAAALKILRAGGVIAHATETCYGLACDLRNPAAVEKLFAIKDRPRNQPVSALFASVDQAREYVVWNDRAEALAKELPGPVTLVLPMQRKVPTDLFLCLLPPPHPSGPPPPRGEGEEPDFLHKRPLGPTMKFFARLMRRKPTRAEQLLWGELRDHKLDHQFRRQHPLGGYILDFYCHQARLCVEVDGGIHNDKEVQKRDAERDELCREEGIRVVRFTNEEVLGNLPAVLSKISTTIRSPSPLGGGVRGGGKSVGVRVSSGALATALVTQFGSPLSTTSANVHGQTNPYSADDLVAQFSGREHRPDLILDSGVLPKNPPSRVLDLTKEEETRVLRS